MFIEIHISEKHRNEYADPSSSFTSIRELNSLNTSPPAEKEHLEKAYSNMGWPKRKHNNEKPLYIKRSWQQERGGGTHCYSRHSNKILISFLHARKKEHNKITEKMSISSFK